MGYQEPIIINCIFVFREKNLILFLGGSISDAEHCMFMHDTDLYVFNIIRTVM
jgi:hypothetical protein